MKTHELKKGPEVFDAVVRLDKTYEIRKDDRGFEVGDRVHLRETEHTGEEMSEEAPLVYLAIR